MQTKNLIAKNKQFFERYAHLISSLSTVATIAQIIAASCEIGILYSLLNSALTDFLTGYWLNIVSTVCALLCAAMLQVGVKLIFPYAVRAILHKHFKGLEMALSIGIFILTVALLTCSISLSFEGSKEVAETIIKAPQAKSTTVSDSLNSAASLSGRLLYSSDSATIETKFKGKKEATESNYNARINAIERTGHKKATSLRAEIQTALGQLKTDLATELQTAGTKRDKSISTASDRNTKEVNAIGTDNATTKIEADLKKLKYKNYIGYFSMFCYLFFLSIFTLNEIYKKGAEIQTKVLPSQRHLNASLLSELKETVLEKFDVFFRTKLYAWHDRTPAQPMPTGQRTLYNHTHDALENTVTVESEAVKTRVVKIPMKIHKTAASSDKSSDDTTQKRAQIGFVKRDDTNASDDTTKIVGGGIVENKTIVTSGTDIIGQCPICLNSFIKNHRKQVYCGTKCRQENHVKRGGKLHESIKVK